MKRELFALTIILLLAVVLPGGLFGYQAWRNNPGDARVIALTGYAPEQGGWQPDTLRVALGERVRLRIASPDVVHSFEVPALGLNSGDILPGRVVEVEFTATEVGRFAFACTRWCSLDHWRMRGIIEVYDPNALGALVPTPAAPPLFQQLGIDLDAMRAPLDTPARRPSAAQGQALAAQLPAEWRNVDWLRTKSPAELFRQLRDDPAYREYDDAQLWDALAALWQTTATPDTLERGRMLYVRDCAACHGETGRGDGPAGKELPGLAAMHPDMERGPADFTDLSQRLTASDVLLQGKILRGGMGTGMPEFGSLYTERELWDVLAYLRSFAFDYPSPTE